jgi:hypothetical protein
MRRTTGKRSAIQACALAAPKTWLMCRESARNRTNIPWSPAREYTDLDIIPAFAGGARRAEGWSDADDWMNNNAAP